MKFLQLTIIDNVFKSAILNNSNTIKDIFLLAKENKSEKVDELKRAILPSSLYKYGRLGENTLACLKRKSIWLSNYKELNDPFESLMKYDLDKHLTEYFLETDFEGDFYRNYGVFLSQEDLKLIRNSQEPHSVYYDLCEQKNLPTFKRPTKSQLRDGIVMLFEKYREYSYIGCFSEVNKSLLMWSHYADNGKGICVEYCLTSIDTSYLFPVFYSDEMYEFSIKDLHTLVRNLIKAKDWEYEQEWRIVYLNDKMRQNNHYVKIPTPTRILLGPRFDENASDHIEALAKIVDDLKLPVFRTQLSTKEYKIIVDDQAANLSKSSR